MRLEHITDQFTAIAIEALHNSTGLRAETFQPEHDGPDICLHVDAGDMRTYRFACEIKTPIDRRSQLITFKDRHKGAVLITRSLSSALAAECRRLGIQFIDQSGNCYLSQPGFIAYVSGLKSTEPDQPTTMRGLTPAALQVVFAVLSQPAILDRSVRHIAEVASISHGAAAAALTVLEGRGLVSSATTGRRQLLMPQRWLDAWTEGYLGRIRPKLEKYSMSSPMPLSTLLEQFSSRMHEIVLGGEAAAAHLGMGLKPASLSLYADLADAAIMRRLVQEFKLRRDPNGPIELINIFWNTHALTSFPTVPPPLIYADLVGAADDRSMEVASTLGQEICKHADSQA